MDMDTGEVRITLKDVYQQQQGLEKTLGENLATLNLTMLSIKTHLEAVDARNLSADLLHKEHAERIRATEERLDRANLPAVLPDTEVRVRALERFKWTLLGAVIVGQVVIGLIEWLIPHK